jgi:hypothetical protein
MIVLQFFIQELLQGGEEVFFFLDANKDEYQPYRPQDHDSYFKTKGGFQVYGSIDNELHLDLCYYSCHYQSYGTVVVFRFCLETEYTCASTLLS